MSDEDTRQETAKERSVDLLHEHLELFLNAVASSAIAPSGLSGDTIQRGNGMNIFVTTTRQVNDNHLIRLHGRC